MQDANRRTNVPPQYSNLQNFLDSANKAGVQLSVTICDSPGADTSSQEHRTRTRVITPPSRFKPAPQKLPTSQSSPNNAKKRNEPSEEDVNALLELSKKAWKKYEQQHASTAQTTISDTSNASTLTIPESITQAALASEPQQSIARR